MRPLPGYRFIFITVLLLLAPLPAFAQVTTPPDGTRITAATVSGFELSKLSPGLQEDIRKLVGTALDRQVVRDLALRIEGEQPRYVAAARVTAEPDDTARVVFVVARLREPNQQVDINAKYIVEDVDVRGVQSSAVSAELRAELQTLVGKPLDTDEAERLHAKLRSAFPDYDVSRRTVRGDQPGHIELVFELHRSESSRFLRFDQLKSNGTYHSHQGWGTFFDMPIGNRDIRVTPSIAIDTTDDLLEEYSGFGLRFETRKLGTERLGLSISGSWFDTKWREQTVAAFVLDPGIPGPYGQRSTFTPVMKFAVTRHLFVSGGVSITELAPPDEAIPGLLESSMANAAIGTLGYSFLDKERSRTHEVEAALTGRMGLESLESDFEYTRVVAQADYSYRASKHQVLVSGFTGFIDGDAPLFERFALGDLRTLRGWNKYDISPAGGDRVAYGSAEYRWRFLAIFVDAGSVWNDGTDRKFRVSVGGGLQIDSLNVTVGIPLNTGDLRAVFMAGLRFKGIGILR